MDQEREKHFLISSQKQGVLDSMVVMLNLKAFWNSRFLSFTGSLYNQPDNPRHDYYEDYNSRNTIVSTRPSPFARICSINQSDSALEHIVDCDSHVINVSQ